MRFISLLGVILAQNADYYNFDEYEASGEAEMTGLAGFSARNCILLIVDVSSIVTRPRD